MHTCSLYRPIQALIPVLDGPVPTARGHLARLQRVPLAADGDLVVRLERAEHAVALPVPDPHLALAVAGDDEAPVRGEVHLKRREWSCQLAVRLGDR